jgi:hypothetical protein
MVVIGSTEFAGQVSKNIKSYPQSYPQNFTDTQIQKTTDQGGSL